MNFIQSNYDFSKEPECDLILEGEFESNGFHNPIIFEKGVVAMAGDGAHEAHGCGFFITLDTDRLAHLQGNFAAFEKVIDGYEEAERIERVPLKAIPCDTPGVVINQPIEDEFIKYVKVETFGVDYPKPKILRWGE